MVTTTPTAEEARPVFRRDMPPRPQCYNFATEALMRLALLAGLRCPNCGAGLVFDGTRTRCDNGVDCGYGWSNPDAAESDIYHGLT